MAYRVGNQMVTPVDLLDLDSMGPAPNQYRPPSGPPNGGMGGFGPGDRHYMDMPNMEKFTRTRHLAPSESGMGNHLSRPIYDIDGPESPIPGGEENIMFEPSEEPKMELVEPKLYCIDVAKHVNDCPVCTKIYTHDLTLYYVVIAVLAIICLLLMKKILHV